MGSVALAAAAAVTDQLRVGTLVHANDYRHPVILAKELAEKGEVKSNPLRDTIVKGWREIVLAGGIGIVVHLGYFLALVYMPTYLTKTFRVTMDDGKVRVFGPDEALAEAAGRLARAERVGILFGRERVGLSNDEVSLADAIVTFPVDPEHASLNLAQSVLLVAYEWRRAAGRAVLPFTGAMRSSPAPREALISLFESLEAELDAAGYYPPEKRGGMIRNMRDMFHRMAMTEQDVRTFRGALRALARRPPEEG